VIRLLERMGLGRPELRAWAMYDWAASSVQTTIMVAVFPIYFVKVAGAGIAEGRLDLVIFFWDPLQTQPHDVDVKALLRITVVHNTPIACNRATADFLLSSPLMDQSYERLVEEHERFGS